MKKAAVISECGQYRYALHRTVSNEPKSALFIMLNPSTADAEQDDATIRKLKGFCERLGYGSFDVVNLFAYRATDPKDLKKARFPVGEENMLHVKALALVSDIVICGWGTHGTFGRQNEKIMAELKDLDLYALEITKEGHPKHPLYISYDKEPIIFRAAQPTNKDTTHE